MPVANRTLFRFSKQLKMIMLISGLTHPRWRTLQEVALLTRPVRCSKSNTDAVELDTWVLDKFERLLKNTSRSQEVQQQGAFFFLHLLGLDTTGHAYRPQSMEYFRNIQAVDALIKRVTELAQEVFQDDKTAFIFTADHGMS
jgi:predicted AlkP superfamily pyrophosphatase or phosphodiesterase